MSKQRRTDGLKATLIIVTNLPHVTSCDVVTLSARRRTVELFIKEVKGVVGLGQAQVTKDPQRGERSVALSVMAYVLLIKLRAKDIPEHGPWSALPSNGALPGRRPASSGSIRSPDACENTVE